MTVLGWILSDSRNYKQFVASRIFEILEKSEASQWRWIPTKENVADDSTRMVLANLSPDARWFNGPEFLKGPEADWPARQVPGQTSKEIRPHAVGHLHFHDASVCTTNYSSWIKLLRVQCFVLRFINNIKAKRTGTTLQLVGITNEEFLDGEKRKVYLSMLRLNTTRTK